MRRPPNRLSLALIAGLLSVSRLSAGAQVDPFDRYTTRPDQWRPASPAAPGVDARGDLSLSIPLLTVPGRAGRPGAPLSRARSARVESRFASVHCIVTPHWRCPPAGESGGAPVDAYPIPLRQRHRPSPGDASSSCTSGTHRIDDSRIL